MLGSLTLETANIADRLPTGARAKLEMLRADVEQHRAIIRHYSDQEIDLGEAVQTAERRLRDQGPAQIEAQESRLAELRARKADLQAKQAGPSDRLEAIGLLVSNIEQWFRSIRQDARIGAVDHVTPKLRKSEAADDAIAILRQSIEAHKAELAAVRSAPLTRGEAKSRARDQINALADSGAPEIAHTLRGGHPIAWPMTGHDLQVMNAQPGASIMGRTPDSMALVAWLHREPLIAAIELQIDIAAGDEAESLSTEERSAKEADLVVAILKAERDEEALIVETEERGNGVRRRPDADPRAVLGLSSDLPSREDV